MIIPIFKISFSGFFEREIIVNALVINMLFFFYIYFFCTIFLIQGQS